MRRNLTLDAALDEAERRYSEANPKSLESYQAACEAMPGGNTRSGLYYAPYPLTLAGGEGARVWDVDGHEYTDFVGELTAGIYGHSHPVITAAIKGALDAGIVLGGHNTVEARLAEALCARIPSLEQLGHRSHAVHPERPAPVERPRQGDGLRGRLSWRRAQFRPSRRVAQCSLPFSHGDL